MTKQAYWWAWTREKGDPCEVCGVPLFRRSRTGVGIGTGHLPECRALSKERHNGSPEVKASKTRYNGTPKAAGNRSRFKSSPKGKTVNSRYMRRADRSCRYAVSGCLEFAVVGQASCVQHRRGDSARRSLVVRTKLATRQDWICTWCLDWLPDNLNGTHVDHVIPVAHAGPNEDWNFDLLHGHCNLVKQDQITDKAIALAESHSVDILECVNG